MLRCHWGTTADGYPVQVAMAVVVSLLAPAELASQHLPGSGELGWRVPANGQAAATVAPQLTRLIAKKSPARALALSVAGTLIPIAAGAIVQANRPRGDSLSGEPAGETYDVVGGVLICVGLLVGPSLGHFYAHERGWFLGGRGGTGRSRACGGYGHGRSRYRHCAGRSTALQRAQTWSHARPWPAARGATIGSAVGRGPPAMTRRLVP